MSLAVRLMSTGWVFASLIFMLFGCSKQEPEKKSEGATPAAVTPAAAEKVTLIGSGATFPAPLYGRWFKEYSQKTEGVTIDYQSVGSGQGVKSFIDGRTDFGASDAAMNDEEIQQVKGNVLLLPMTAGSIVLAYNLDGVPSLKLTRDAYTGIFLGEITKWNDPKIAEANPGVSLPDQAISVVTRSDGSGTTYVFTQHLSAINDKWKQGPGTGKSVEWPTSKTGGSAAKGNEGVSAQIKQTPGSIGYIEYAYAVLTKQPMASLQNKAGTFVAPTLESSTAALASVELPENMRAWITDPEGDNSYPIATYTWILAKKKYDSPAKAKAIKAALKWALTDGQKISPSLEYIPLPEKVANKVLAAVETIN